MTLDLPARWRSRHADAGSTRSGGVHYPCFDGLRALAALTVLGVHTTFVSGFTTNHPGWGRYTSRLEIGVQVFFVISGFLLYRPFAVEHFGGRDAPTAGKFWVRRLKRIVPAYWLAFIVATYVLKADSGGPGWKGPLIFLSFGQIYFPQYILHGLSQAWSLCVEMTFYLMIPLYAALLGRRRRPAAMQLRLELGALAALTAISFAYRIPVVSAAWHDRPRAGVPSPVHGHLVQTMPNWLPGYLDQFALGMLLAVVSAYAAGSGRRPEWLWHPVVPWACWSLAALSFWAVANIGLPLTPVTDSPLGPSLARQLLYGLFAFFLVLPAVFGPQDRGVVRILLRWRPLALAGVISYGIYLWHEAWIHMYLVWSGQRLFDMPLLVVTIAVAALAVASATLSYRLVERPVLRSGFALRSRFRPEPSGAGQADSQVAPLIGARP
ncbi:MAG TPA: acyltransferase [Acidimicrobiales bacterium]|nr:acyltransferase [Acidimicrobiales bacterium]